jgi:serine protease inhibitor
MWMSRRSPWSGTTYRVGSRGVVRLAVMERSHTEFALALHERLPATGNLPWSPYSVASALGVAATGARGPTRDELVRVLAPGGDLAELGRMLTAAARLTGAEAAVANAIWTDQRLRFRDEYLRQVRGWPGGTAHTTDFRADPEGARRSINEDVAATTRGLIRDLIARGMITPETAAVIVNALYLKVAWQHPFPEAATGPADFHTPSGVRQVPTMRQQQSFPYAEVDGWRMVSLPTGSDEAVVDLLLPPDRSAPLPTARTLLDLRSSSRPTRVDLAVPRFRVEAAEMLNPHLRQLGVVAAFQRADADFTGMTEQAEIFVDAVVHKTVLRVDEQGFEGAAATAVVMRLASLDRSRPVEFHLDRPFLLLARHRRTGAIYFLARVETPGTE